MLSLLIFVMLCRAERPDEPDVDCDVEAFDDDDDEPVCGAKI